jgi:hypothetical protein
MRDVIADRHFLLNKKRIVEHNQMAQRWRQSPIVTVRSWR